MPEKLRPLRQDNTRNLAIRALDWMHGLTAGTFPARGRVIIEGVEGPRFDPTDFATLRSVEELDSQIDALFGDDGTLPLTPEGK